MGDRLPASPVSRTIERQQSKRMSGVFTLPDLTTGGPANPHEEVGVEDGPVFRATIVQLERGAQQFKVNLRGVIRAIGVYMDKGREMTTASDELLAAFKTMEALEPACRYLEDMFARTRELQEMLFNQIQSLLVDPLEKMYANDLRDMEAQKAHFDREGEAFTQVVEKYLATDSSKKQSKLDKTDQKFHDRRTNYNLVRFDYLTYMEELHTRKEQEVLYYTCSMIEKQAAYMQKLGRLSESLKPARDDLNAQVAETWTDINNWLKERQEMRQAIQKSSQAAAERLIERASLRAASAGADKKNKYKGIRDLDSGSATAVPASEVKQGFLYTKYNREWKKVWCVVANGVFTEYIHWKAGPKNGTRTPLHTCTVKPAVKAERRFCFELISPQVRRIFQAHSEEEASLWMQVIQKAIEASLERPIPPRDLQPGDVPPQQLAEADSRVRREIMRDPSNEQCADCGARDPDWCAINLGVCLCITCSGIHRSLGVHISKIRSFTLDINSWTPELMAVQRGLGNATANRILEATLAASGATRPEPTSSREARQAFATAKYAMHAYTEPLPPNAVPARELLDAVVRADLPAALQALAWGADPNAPINGGSGSASSSASSSAASLSRSMPILSSPLAACAADDDDHAAPRSYDSPTLGPAPLPDETPAEYIERMRPDLPPLHTAICNGRLVMAEFLIANGADVCAQDRAGNTPLHYAALLSDEHAVNYLLTKSARLDTRNRVARRPVDMLPADADKSLLTLLTPSLSSSLNSRAVRSAVGSPG